MSESEEQDVKGIIDLEHFNVNIPDQPTAQIFYTEVLGFTRDPQTRFGPGITWINLGESQFHLATQPEYPQALRGHVGIIVPSLSKLNHRLEQFKQQNQNTSKFQYSKHTTPTSEFQYHYTVHPKIDPKTQLVEWTQVTGLWGEAHYHFYQRQAQLDRQSLPEEKNIGIAYIEEPVQRNAASTIGKFYEHYFGAPVTYDEGRRLTRVRVGYRQELIFREVKEGEEVVKWSGYHVCIYISDFKGSYEKFKKADMLYKHNRFEDKYETLELALKNHQYRIADIVDPDGSGSDEKGGKEIVHQLEHEVRSLGHPYFKRSLVNRWGNCGVKV